MSNFFLKASFNIHVAIKIVQFPPLILSGALYQNAAYILFIFSCSPMLVINSLQVIKDALQTMERSKDNNSTTRRKQRIIRIIPLLLLCLKNKYLDLLTFYYPNIFRNVIIMEKAGSKRSFRSFCIWSEQKSYSSQKMNDLQFTMQCWVIQLYLEMQDVFWDKSAMKVLRDRSLGPPW